MWRSFGGAGECTGDPGLFVSPLTCVGGVDVILENRNARLKRRKFSTFPSCF